MQISAVRARYSDLSLDRGFNQADVMVFLSTQLLRTEQCTEVRFASLLSGGFTTMAVINPPEKKLAKRTSVRCRCDIHQVSKST